MFNQSLIHHRPALLDSVLFCCLVQVQNSDALTTFFQTTFKAQDDSHSSIVEGEVATDINSSQVSFKLSNNSLPQSKIWEHPERLSLSYKQSSCPQVSSPYSGETSLLALLIDNCLLSGIPINDVTLEIKENSIIWLDIPILKSGRHNKRITPVFRVTRSSSNEKELIIKAQPLNCDQCPHRQKGGRSDNKCCGGCEGDSESTIFDSSLESLSSAKPREHFFEPVEIRYKASTNEVHFDFNTTQGVFTTKLSLKASESPISESLQAQTIPLALLLSATILIQSRTKE